MISCFAYQMGAGMGWQISEQFVFDLRYRFFGTADPEFEVAEYEFSSHDVYVGLRYYFPVN